MSDNIIVALRLRQLISREIKDPNLVKYWQVQDNNIVQIDPQTKKQNYSFAFDEVFDENGSNGEIFQTLAYPIVQAGLAGINGTIFAYGQTSSGKTFTMTGSEKAPGVIPLSIQNIFNSIEKTPDREFLLRASYMEIYQENIFDLLTGSKISSLREDTSGQVIVPGLKEVCVTSEDMLLSVMADGDKRRKIGETNMNERSSRSHSIFRLIIESREMSDKDCEGAVTVSHLNLVDLAGSENASQTGALGERLKEGGAINKSLFMLGRVISQLSDGEAFVNFRDSKLTRILQNSLGGNAKTTIVCTVTPASKEQTLSTLRFASRAKSIQNKPVVNEVLSESALLKRYAVEINKLKIALETERSTDRAQEVEQVKEKLDEQEKKNLELQDKLKSLKEKLVVSSHSIDAKITKKEKKIRRETWAAPAIRRAFRMSLAPPDPSSRPILQETFLKPMSRPRDTSLADIAEGSSLSDSPSTINDSVASFEENSDWKEALCSDEISKVMSLDDSAFLSPQMIPLPRSSRRRRRKAYTPLSPPLLQVAFSDAQCQTDETLLPKPAFLAPSPLMTPPRRTPPKGSPFPSSPSGGTPKEVLRSINLKLKDVLETKEMRLGEWRLELRELEDFHQQELLVLRSEFEEKRGEGFFDQEDLDHEMKNLKKSLEDSQKIYLDTNKTVSEQTNLIAEMRDRIQHLEEENQRFSVRCEDRDVLKHQLDALRKELKDVSNERETLKGEKTDFDMLMELSLTKQKQTEAYLRRNLDDAWAEIAKLEGCSKADVLDRNSKVEELHKELERVSALLELGNSEKQVLVDSNSSLQSELEQASQDLRTEKESVTLLEAEVESLRNEKRDNAFKVPKLQTPEGGQDRRSPRISHSSNWDYTMYTCEDRSPLEQSCFMNLSHQVTNPLEISRKLSETLNYLNESVLVGSSPADGESSGVDLSEVLLIRDQLLNLQEMLFSQDLVQQQQQAALMAAQIVEDYQKECDAIALLESLWADYVHVWAPGDQSERSFSAEVRTATSANQGLAEVLSTTSANQGLAEGSFCDESLYIEAKGGCDASKVFSLADELAMAALNETEIGGGEEERAGLLSEVEATQEVEDAQEKRGVSREVEELQEHVMNIELREVEYKNQIEELKHQILVLEEQLRSPVSSQSLDVSLRIPNEAEETTHHHEVFSTPSKEPIPLVTPISEEILSDSPPRLELSTVLSTPKEPNHSEETSLEDEIKALKAQLDQGYSDSRQAIKALEEERDSLLERLHERALLPALLEEDCSVASSVRGDDRITEEDHTFITEAEEDAKAEDVHRDAPSGTVVCRTCLIAINSPLKTNTSTNTSPLRGNTTTTTSPFNADATTNTSPLRVNTTFPITANATTNTSPFKTNANTTTSPLKTNATTTTSPLKTYATTNTSPLKSNATSPTTANAATTTTPLKTNATTTTSPLHTNAPIDLRSLESKIAVQEELIESLQAELSELREREDELEEMITEFTLKEERLEERETLVREAEENFQEVLEAKETLVRELQEEISTLKASCREGLAPNASEGIGEDPTRKEETISQNEDCQLEEGLIGHEVSNLGEDTDPELEVEGGRRSPVDEEVRECCKASLDRVNLLVKEKQNLTADLAALQDIICSLELEEKVGAEWRERLEKEVEELKGERLAIEKEAKELKGERDAIEKEAKELKSVHQTLRDELNDASLAVETLKEEVNASEVAGRRAEERCLVLEGEESQRCQEMERRISSLLEKVAMQTENTAALEGTIEGLKEELRRGEKDQQALALSSELAVLERRYSEKVTEEASLQERVEARQVELQEAMTKLKASEEDASRLRKDAEEGTLLKEKMREVERALQDFGLARMDDVADLLTKASTMEVDLTTKVKECDELSSRLRGVEQQRQEECAASKSQMETLSEKEAASDRKLQEKEDLVRALTDDVATLKEECKHYCLQIATLEKASNEGREMTLTGEVERLMGLVREKEQAMKICENRVENLKVSMEKKMALLDEEKQTLEEEVAQVRSALSEKEEQLREFSEGERKHLQEAQAMKACLEAKELECRHLEQKVGEIEDLVSVRHVEVEALGDAKEELQAKVEELTKVLATLEIARENLVVEKQNLEGKLTAKEEEMAVMVLECDALKCDIDTLQTDGAAILEALEESQLALQAKENLLSELETELGEARSSHEGCAEKEAKNAMEVEKLVNLIEKYESEAMEKELSGEKMAQEMKVELAKSKEALAEALLESESKVEEKRKDVERLQGAMKEIEQKLDKCRKEKENELKEMELRLELLQQDKDSIKHTLDDLQNEKKFIKQSLEDLQKENEDKLEKYENDLKQMKHRLEGLENEKQKEIQKYENELKETKHSIEVLRRENTELTSMKTKLVETTLNVTEAEDLSLMENVSTLKEENRILSKALQKAKEDLQEKCVELQTMSDMYDKDVNYYEERLGGFTTTLKTYKIENETLKTEKQELSETLNSMSRVEKGDSSINATLKSDEGRGELVSQNASLRNEIIELKSRVLQLTEALRVERSSHSNSSSSLNISTTRQSKQKLLDKIEELNSKILSLRLEVNELRHNDAITLSDEGMQKHLEWMRNEVKQSESLNKLLNANYDSLEKENAELEAKVSDLQLKLEQTHSGEPTQMRTPDARSSSCWQETTPEKPITKDTSTSSNEHDFSNAENESEKSLQKKYIELKIERDVLKMKLQGLDAPSQKEAQRLKEELEMEQCKNKKLWMELRRVQNTNLNDMTIMETNHSTAKFRNKAQENNSETEMDCGFGSKIVLDVQMMGLKNINYHLEKEKAKLTKELEVLKEHLQHYKVKASEWKTKCHKESLRVKSLEEKKKLKEDEEEKERRVEEKAPRPALVTSTTRPPVPQEEVVSKAPPLSEALLRTNSTTTSAPANGSRKTGSMPPPADTKPISSRKTTLPPPSDIKAQVKVTTANKENTYARAKGRSLNKLEGEEECKTQ